MGQNWQSCGCLLGNAIVTETGYTIDPSIAKALREQKLLAQISACGGVSYVQLFPSPGLRPFCRPPQALWFLSDCDSGNFIKCPPTMQNLYMESGGYPDHSCLIGPPAHCSMSARQPGSDICLYLLLLIFYIVNISSSITVPLCMNLHRQELCNKRSCNARVAVTPGICEFSL